MTTEDTLKLLKIPPTLIEDELKRLENRVWIPDSVHSFRLAVVVEDYGRELLVKFRDSQGFNQQKRVEKCTVHRTSVSHYCADMCDLTELNEACALHTIRSRYEQQVIHTYSGLFCVVLNPWKRVPLYNEEMMEVYMNSKLNSTNLPPHVYAVAQNAYEGIKLTTGSDQSILITGESGAGKTENTKKIIEYLIKAANQNGIPSTSQGIGGVQEAILSAGIALEAFSNARTIHNSNSSRLGKFIKLDFDEKARLNSANIECYLLEKSRVVSQNEGDRNFHIFYEVFANEKFANIRSKLGLRSGFITYKYLNQGGSSAFSGMNDEENAVATVAALKSLGFDDKSVEEIVELIIGIILLGEMRFGERSGMDVSYPERMDEIETASNVLQVRSSRLVDAVTEPSFKVGERLIRRSQNLKKSLLSVAAMAKIIYQKLFDYILRKCNQTIVEKSGRSLNSNHSGHFIGVLDMAGFEIMSTNSFEQLCINFTNEKLQQFFNHFMFIKEQNEYLNEGIEWDQMDFGDDLQPTIELIEKPMGLLSLLQEECIIPNSSDQTLLAKLVENLASENGFNKVKMSSRNKSTNHFLLTHYTGQVAYNVDGWLEKNRDQVDSSILELLNTSTHPLLKELFKKDESKSSRRGSLAQSTVSFIYKEQLSSLLNTLNRTQSNFIRCIVPNTSRRPFEMDSPLVLHQLKCNGVLEGLRICQRGYPTRIFFDEFVQRYIVLAPNIDRTLSPVKQVVQMVEALNLDLEKFQIGRSKLFCKSGFLSELEDLRKAKISECIVLLQAQIRWYHEQKRTEEKRKEWEAISIIQDNVRMAITFHSWPWMKLLKRTRELIPMKREKERLIQLEKDMDAMKKLCDLMKSEKEELIHKNQRLEERLEEIERETENERRKKYDVEEELRRNENLLEAMESRFDEQHAKIMKLNTTLKENVATLERLEVEKRQMSTQLSKLKEELAAEITLRTNAEQEYENICMQNEELERRYDTFRPELDHLRVELEKKSEIIFKLEGRLESSEEKLKEMRHDLAEANEKLNSVESSLHSERSQKRQFEMKNDELEEELANLEEEVDKINVQKDALKEQTRVKDNTIRKLERQLDEKKTEMENCINELKKSHKAKQFEMQNQLDELKRKVLKLESENKQQKAKLDNDRETSMEPDLPRPGSSLSRYGSRLSMNTSIYSINSSSSLSGAQATSSGIGSSIRTYTRTRRNEDEHRLTSSCYSDTTSSKYLPKSPSSHRLSRQSTLSNVHQVLELERSASNSSIHQSNLQSSERKCAQTERELQTVKTDLQLAKRELEVYKQSLQEAEMTKESQSRQLKQLTREFEQNEKALKEEETKNQTLELHLKKVQKDLEYSRKKVEDTIAESKNDIMAERKRLMDKMNKMQVEYDNKIQLLQSNNRANEGLQTDLIETRGQLDRAMLEIGQLNKLQRSQSTIGETWEQQYRAVILEMEAIRDENASLKSKIRRQYKQIELLSQQSDLDDCVSELEDRMEKIRPRFDG
uniref:Myosin motor domain-containing protein n=1 Tax=Bursaphelenchus xylophilus TaxID=6326 RepID=A0A1I7RIC1_BURXY